MRDYFMDLASAEMEADAEYFTQGGGDLMTTMTERERKNVDRFLHNTDLEGLVLERIREDRLTRRDKLTGGRTMADSYPPLTEREEEALKDIQPGTRFTHPHNIRVLNSLVRKRVLWAYSDGFYALIDPSTGYPAPSTQGADAFERYERAMLCGGDPGADFAPNH